MSVKNLVDVLSSLSRHSQDDSLAHLIFEAFRRLAADQASGSLDLVMPRRFDHIDLRTPRLAEVAAFYEMLLPALGFTRKVEIEGWLQFESGEGDITEFFGVTESAEHVPNETRIAFWASNEEEVDRLAEVAKNAGAMNLEGPMVYQSGYYAIFFEDPCGNRLEVCHRVASES